ncbi:MAG: TetR-like C-terminal domain-containing protein, partial [Phenylobacterium sp.]
LDALAMEGWDQLAEQMRTDLALTDPGQDRLVALGIAYVRFSRENPAIYRVMFDCSQNHEAMPFKLREEGAYRLVRDALIETGLDPSDETGLELASTAVWCAAHGVAEMVGFREFSPLKAHLGGEDAFLRALLSRLTLFAAGRESPAG